MENGIVKGRIIVYTDKYKDKIGKTPRGEGKWLFSFKDKEGARHEVEYDGMFKECKLQAIDLAYNYGAESLELEV